MIGRLVTAAVGIPALALVVWAGGPVFTVAVAAAAAIGAFEVCGMARERGLAPSRAAAAILAAALVLSLYAFAPRWPMPEYALPLAVSVGIAALASILIFWPGGGLRTRGVGLTLGAAAYPGALLAHAPLLHALEQGLEWVVLLLAVTFATDTAAYFVGRTAGQRPLAPAISPNKTWEGAIAGFVAAALAAFVAAWALGIDAGMPAVIALGALMGIVGQAGDLFESKLKRIAGVKESGGLLPGHGGILDRLDSIVFNLALVYYGVTGGLL